MKEKPDQAHVKCLIMEYIKEELKEDYDIDIASESQRVNLAIMYKRPDGGLYVRFHYHYDEEGDNPANDHTAFVFFRGSMRIDPQGNVVSRSLEMADQEIRASGPSKFLVRDEAAHPDHRKERDALIAWEETLRCGALVEARFSTSGGVYFEFIGEIAKINPKSFRVILRNTDNINSDFEGENISIPRRLSSAFSDNNGVFPLD